MKTKFRQNIDAIKLLKQLEAEGRRATPSEQAILAKFNGWGTLAKAFDPEAKDWAKEYQQLKELLTDEEYKKAKAATPNAFYTSPEIARAIWTGLKQLGFTEGRILAPSMGTGIFFGTMPQEFEGKTELTGVELDNLTGRIAQQLYQKAAIDIMGFQDRKMPNNYFDLAISNVPFGQIKYEYGRQSYNIHNYFFAKSIDKVRPGGLVVFITGTGTMQSGEDAAILRAMVNGKADLIAAFKLPDTTFDKNAGTAVTSDVLILDDAKKPSEYAQDWLEVGEYEFEKEYPSGTYITKLPLNQYYKNPPSHLIGKVKDTGLY